MDVVCTAGHVDHGKSTLVRALTGMEPDRFAEEQRRGLTIDLGFAWTEMSAAGANRTVAFVDLPGHERFIANMLAGAGPVEVALFVVAADEGWKPQSSEHLEILDVLGVRSAVVALTKTDSVDTNRVNEIAAAVAGRLDGTSLAAAPIVAVSAATSSGLDELREQLLAVLSARRGSSATGNPRLWIDRAFTIKGSGTVVTGTLTGGALRVGDEIAIRPGSQRGRIRSLQSLQQPVVTAAPGDRVAVNLAGVGHDEVQRGQLLTIPHAPDATSSADVFVRTLPDRSAGRRGAWHIHVGSGRWTARLRPFSTPLIDGDGFVRLLLDSPAPLLPGDRFVLRDAGGRQTVGGGVVLDAYPPVVRGSAQRRDRVAALGTRHDALTNADTAGLLSAAVAERGAAPAIEVAAQLGLIDETAAAAGTTAKLLRLGDGLAAPRAAARWSGEVLAAVAAHHAAHPLERSAPRGVAIAAAEEAGCPAAYAGELLAVLVRLRRLVAEGAGVRTPDHRVTLSGPDQVARDRLLAALQADPFSPPRLSDAAAAAGASATLVRELEADGALVRLGADLVVTTSAIGSAGEILRAAYAENGPLTASAAKAALGTSRKFAVPLLEELDRRGITRRNGDVREVSPIPLTPADR